MKSFLRFASVLVTAVALVVAEVDVEDSCERDDYVSDLVSTSSGSIVIAAVPSNTVDTDSTHSSAPTVTNDTTHVFAPIVNPALDRTNLKYAIPHTNVSLYYASNTTVDSSVRVNHTMRYPTVVLEQIAYVSNVDCTNVSVAVTFNDSAVFETTQSSWASQGKFVMITNHLGDCDPELQRGFFLVDSITFDNETLVATAGSAGTNVSSTAAETEIIFGNIGSTAGLARRAFGDLVVDPTYSIAKTFSLAEDLVLYKLDPYLTVSTTDSAQLTGNVTFSGYLKYNWLSFKLKDLTFDIDASMSADLALSAAVSAQYNGTFSYAPAVLFYGVSVPGILEIGPQLQFGIDAFVAASAKAVVTTELSAEIEKGNVHVDILNQANTKTSGWTPTYGAKVNVSGLVEAQFNPAAVLTVEIAINFFSGLLDLSTGLTASAGFDNSLVFSAAAGVDLKGVEHLSANGTCSQGLLLESDFNFDVKAFVTQFYKVDLYNVTVPLLDECFSWEK